MRPISLLRTTVLHRAPFRSSRLFPLRGLASAAANPPTSSDSQIRLVEVGPRDGLQNEKSTIPVATKIELIEKLAKTGLKAIESGSFVSPKWVPQMASSGDILAHILETPPASPEPISYSFLLPNTKGMEAFAAVLKTRPSTFATQLEPGSKPEIEVAIFAAATESFTQKNLNCSMAESLDRFRPVIQEAKALGMRVRAYLSVVLGCPFEGPDVDPHQVAELATDLLGAGADEISLGDTTGMGTAPRTKELLRCVTAAGVRNEDLAVHFHDTFGQSLVNIAVALEHGVRTVDCAVGGLGGCPYSPGATGNVATEDVVYFIESLGMDTGVDLDAVADIGAWISQRLGRTHASAVGKAVLGSRQRSTTPTW